MTIKELLLDYAIYSRWAHERLLDLINTLTPEQHHATTPSSFDSLYKTISHIWGAESIWLARLSNGTAKTPGDPFGGSMKKITDSLKEVDENWVKWIREKSDSQLTEKMHYTNSAVQEFYQPYDILLTHIFNHNTYHNGQLVTMLRTLGVEKIPSTDFIAWSRLQLQ
jgi:uncharacterized damage-inducible protein DinB